MQSKHAMTRPLLLSACLAALLAGCGSTAGRQAKAAAIRVELHKLLLEIEADRRKLRPNTLGGTVLIFDRPPRGVSRTEWLAAVRNDGELQRTITALQNGKR